MDVPQPPTMNSAVPPSFQASFPKGAWWMILSLVCFTLNALLLKYLGSTLHVGPWQSLLFRAVIGFAMVLLIFPQTGGKVGLDLRRAATHRTLISRGVLGAFGTAAYYITLPVLGAGKSTLIGNTWVIWSALMAIFALQEKMVWRQFLGIGIAIGGLILLTGSSPQLETVGQMTHEIIAITGALVAAWTVVVIRQLTRTDSSATIFASQCIYTAMLALPFVFLGEWHHSALGTSLLVATACLASFGQLAMTEGFRHLPISVGGAFQVILPLSITLSSVALFDETFSAVQAIGGSLILFGGYQTVARRPA
jgi:drug/metabolite transporter (DMT)-like permease